ncbi:hypothetical protein FRB95_012721, partial [Tulasnella sp. JGI-2019a]
MLCGLESIEIRSLDIISLARSKLTHRDAPTSFDLLQPLTQLAVLDVRLAFAYNPTRTAILDTIDTLVANHMRVVYSARTTREYMQTGYPSEPILAEAAAKQMNEPGISGGAVLAALAKNVRSGLFDERERNVLTARFLLTIAYDRAVKKEGHGMYSHGVEVITFIQELFLEEYAEEILASHPANV